MFDIVIQTTLKHALAIRSKESTKWTAQMSIIDK